MLRPLTALALLVVATAVPVLGDCENVQGNRLVNCSFDTGVGAWSVTGTGSHDDATGNDWMGGLLAGTTFQENGAIAVYDNPSIRLGQCVDMGPGPVQFQVSYRSDNYAAETCYVNMREYSELACADASQTQSWQLTDGSFTGGWEAMGSTIESEPSTRSVSVEANCVGTGGGSSWAVFDDAVLRSDTLYVFTDAFEAGTSRWSGAQV